MSMNIVELFMMYMQFCFAKSIPFIIVPHREIIPSRNGAFVLFIASHVTLLSHKRYLFFAEFQWFILPVFVKRYLYIYCLGINLGQAHDGRGMCVGMHIWQFWNLFYLFSTIIETLKENWQTYLWSLLDLGVKDKNKWINKCIK